jgi:hypothetical protein
VASQSAAPGVSRRVTVAFIGLAIVALIVIVRGTRPNY